MSPKLIMLLFWFRLPGTALDRCLGEVVCSSFCFLLHRPIVKSLPYAITDPSGYIAPDQTKARSVTSYDELGRSLGSVTYDNAGTIVLSSSFRYTVAKGVTGISADSANFFEQTIALDAYNHQSITYTDALGQVRYTQVFSGEGSSYNMVRTVYQHSDYRGNIDIVQTYDSTGAIQATYTAAFDGLSRRTGFNDSDLGSCSNTPLPAGCSNSSDQAWKFSYDADGNQLSSSDPRNKQVYIGYDVLDRPLCRGVAATDVSPTCQNTAYAKFFYDSYDNTSNQGVSFPSGCNAPTGSYASDPIGHVTAERFTGNGNVGSGWRCYGYDQRGQLDQSGLSVTADGQTTTQSINLLYNDGGEVTGLVYPDGETVTSQYDSNGRFQSSYFGTPGTPNPVPFLVGETDYTAWGQVSGTAIGGSGPKASGPTTPVYTTAVSYDGIERLQGSSATRNSRTFWSQTRTYDNVGNVLGLSTTVPTQGGGTKNDVQAFCYDALNRLAWAGNNGTPSGGDHCMTAPTGTTLATYQQAYSYDDLDRLTSGENGTLSYTDDNHLHAASRLGSVPNLYANYDEMGNMTCRNIDTTTAHTCAIGNATGAIMSYDVEGRLDNWTAPNGTTANDKFLYDNEGNRVLQRTSTGGTITDTITFDGYTETSISGGSTTTMKYYSANGQRVAMKVNATLSYLLSDGLGSATLALNSDGSGQALQLFSPYGTVRFSWGTMPTTYNFTGQRLDNQTGLLYYNFRYYDPVSGRFVRADTVENNTGGMDPYAYVGDSPESRTDSSGHDPYYDFLVEDWYITLEAGYGNGVDAQVPIQNAAVPELGKDPITGHVTPATYQAFLDNLKQLAKSGGNPGHRGIADLVNHSLSLIYDVKSGGNASSDGTVPPPSYYTIAAGWAQVQYYATLASQDPNFGHTMYTGSLVYDTPLANTFQACGLGGTSCLIPMAGKFGGTALVLITYAGGGVLTYSVIGTPSTSPNYQNAYEKWWQRYGRYLLVGLAVTVASGSLSSGDSNSGGEWPRPAGAGCSFTPNTLVWTSQGKETIRQLKIGDEVLAYNPFTQVMEIQPIEHVWVHNDSDLVDLTIENTTLDPLLPTQANQEELIHTTDEHPFLTREYGFVPAGQLKIGTHIQSADGNTGLITMIHTVTGTMEMYNLEVANDHTFTIGDGQWIVHNVCLL